MKLISLTIFLFAILFPLDAQTDKEIKADIKHVTVFPDRAQIDHETAISPANGTSVLRFTELSPYIDPQSVQVKGFGNFTILSVNHRNNFLRNLEDNPELKSIKTQIESLQLKVEDEKAAISVLKEKAAFLTANRPLLVKETTVTAEHFRTVMDLYTNSMDQVTMASLKRERQIKEYEKQLDALQRQLADRTEKEKLPSGEVSVTLQAEKQVSGKLTLSYVVSNAGWYPSYDIRVDDIKSPVNISYKANVFQNSGNQWKDVMLSFSNATPWVSGNIPGLNPWFIDFYTPVYPALRGRLPGVTTKARVMDVNEAQAEAPMQVQEFDAAPPPEVQRNVGQTTVNFDVSIPYTIPSDGEVNTVEIQRLTAPADYKYVTVPKMSPHAYLAANITGWADLSLQSGEATLYFENSFVGKSQLDVNQLTDTLSVSLGTDNSILVKREKRKDFTSSRTLGANKTETTSFLITVRNNKQVPVKINVKDQLPLSSNSSIEVNPIELSGGRYNQQTGHVDWELDIKPSESRQLILTYSVKYPKDRTIILE